MKKENQFLYLLIKKSFNKMYTVSFCFYIIYQLFYACHLRQQHFAAFIKKTSLLLREN